MLAWFRSAFAQDDFARDWYGYLTNQISHIGLGIVLALATCIVWFWAFGEYPVKWAMWLAIAGGYAASEVIRALRVVKEMGMRHNGAMGGITILSGGT
jgi:hypothetical protein